MESGRTKAVRPAGGVSGLILLVLGVAGIVAWGWGAWWVMARPGVFEAWGGAWSRVRSEGFEPRTTAPPVPEIAPPSPIPPARPGPNGEMIRPPSWSRQPMPMYPQAAMRAGIEEGTVELRCEALASGQLGACEVMSETPQGVGFGEEALAATRDARLSPRTIDDVATDGTLVFTVRYRMDNGG